MTRHLTRVAALALCLGAPAHAFEELTFGAFTLTPGFGANLTAETSGGTPQSNAYGYLDATLTYRHAAGALTLGAEAYASVEFDNDAAGRNLYVYDDPYIDLGLWLEGERFGYLSYSYTSSAIGEGCVEAPSAGDNYAHGDYVTVGTCPSHDTRSVLYYRTPDLGRGLKLAVSYMPETGFERVAAGEAAESVSAALYLDRESADGAHWTGSLGVERVLKRQGAGGRLTSWQGGLSRAAKGWTLGGAFSLTDNGDGTTDRAVGLSAMRDIGDRLQVSLGVNRSHSGAGGADLDETAVSILAKYSFIPDKLLLDGGVWHIESDAASGSADRDVIALGLSLYF